MWIIVARFRTWRMYYDSNNPKHWTGIKSRAARYFTQGLACEAMRLNTILPPGAEKHSYSIEVLPMAVM